MAAAAAVQCLPEDMRYSAVGLLFARTAEWTRSGDVVSVFEDAFGEDFSLRPGESLRDGLAACVAREDFLRSLFAASIDAARNGVSSTPYFIVGGEHILGAQSAEVIGSAVERALAD